MSDRIKVKQGRGKWLMVVLCKNLMLALIRRL